VNELVKGGTQLFFFSYHSQSVYQFPLNLNIRATRKRIKAEQVMTWARYHQLKEYLAKWKGQLKQIYDSNDPS